MACSRALLLLLLTGLAKGQEEVAAPAQLEEQLDVEKYEEDYELVEKQAAVEEEVVDLEKSELVEELLEDDLERQGRQEGERDPVASPDLDLEEELDSKNEEQSVQNEELELDPESEERQARQTDPDADADAGGGDDPDTCEECEEAWAYVEFLKESVSKKVEMILEETLFEAKVRTIDLDKTVAEAMKQVMEMRQSLLDRIKKIRKGDAEITICPGQDVRQEEKLSQFRMRVMSILLKLVDTDAANVDGLTDIGNSLLGFKAEVGDEIMRLLTLPQPKGCSPNPPKKTECPECDPIAMISKKLEKLIKCASKEDGADQQEATQQQEEEDGCAELDPTMYAMELITCNEKVDEEIKNLYQQIVGSVDDSERQKGFDSLNGFKGIRNQIDEVIKSLLDETPDDCDEDCQKKLKKIVQRNLRGVSSDTKQLLEDCTYLNGCVPGAACEGCAVEVLQDTISRLDGYSTFFTAAQGGDQEAEEQAKESIRADMMSFINQITSDSTSILREKVTDDGDLDECKNQKLEVYAKLKGPLWMLVNETIFTPTLESLSITVVAAANMSDLLLAEYCSESPRPPSNDGPTCDWEEYEQTSKYLEKVDEIIQEALFKADKDDAQMTALRGFVDLQKLLDNRVKVLFQNLLTCPAEVDVIKKDYMSQLNKCMAEFMNGRLKFEEMSKSQRISCTKVLRTKMEERMSKLLSSELEQSFNQIQDRDQSES